MIEILRQYRHGQPFIPFTIQLANGKSLEVPHPDFIFMSHGVGSQIFVNDTEKDDYVHVLNAQMIVSISRLEQKAEA